LGSGIRDPGSGKNLFRIPGSKRHRIPDPGSGSATLGPGSKSKDLLNFFSDMVQDQHTVIAYLLLDPKPCKFQLKVKLNLILS
jgi:hypothetical protein